MADSPVSTFMLGALDAGTDVDVALLTPAAVRLVPEGAGAIQLLSPQDMPVNVQLKPFRRFTVPRAGHWRILVEHAEPGRQGGCSIRLSQPDELY
jgi:hypothetical protein